MQKKTVGLAAASLVLGILIYVVAGQLVQHLGTVTGDGIAAIVFGIPAIICGHLAKSKIKRNPAQLKGGGMAITGLVLGYLAVVGTLGLAIDIRLEHGNNETSRKICVTNLRAINNAKWQWEFDSGKPKGSLVKQSDLTIYFKDGVVPTCPKGGSYSYNPTGVDPECSIHGKLKVE